MKRKIYTRTINIASIVAVALILVANYFNSGAIAWWALSGASLFAIIGLFGYFALHWQSTNDNESTVTEDAREDAISNVTIIDSQTMTDVGKFENYYPSFFIHRDIEVLIARINEDESLEVFSHDRSIARISPRGTVFVKGKTPAPGKAKYPRNSEYAIESSAGSRGSGDISKADWREPSRRGYVH